MIELPTPETDAKAEEVGMGHFMVDAEFSRKLERERDEAIAARKASATDWLNQIEQANARVSRALQQVALVERERDEAREAIIPFITLNPKSQRVQKKWNGFVEAAKKALEGAK